MKSNIINRERTGFGTREWAEESANICLGCSHNCRYCYARDKALSSNLITSEEDWATERVNMEKVNARQYKRDNNLTMFPTNHDITPAILEPCLTVMTNMLQVGKNLLVVSKPHQECIRTICERFTGYKAQILFRFTIGSLDAERTAFFEPGAPTPQERLECLKLACRAGYKTSVSIEPMLEDEIGTRAVISAVYPYVTEDIWIGMMNSLRRRFVGSEQELSESIRYFYHANSRAAVIDLYNRFKDDWKIKWKESVQREIDKYLLDQVEPHPGVMSKEEERHCIAVHEAEQRQTAQGQVKA